MKILLCTSFTDINNLRIVLCISCIKNEKERTFHCKNEIIKIYYENIKVRLLKFIESIFVSVQGCIF